MRGRRGEGRIYRRGDRYWIGYYVGGKQYREPCGTEAAAKRKLKARRKEIAKDQFIGPQEERVTVGELLDDLLTHQDNKGAKGVAKLRSHVKAVRSFFEDRQAASVTTPLVERYTQERLALPRARATVNRELEALRQAFNLAGRRTPPRVTRIPYIPLLKVENARQGFLSRADFTALLANLTDNDVRDYIEFFWWTGMRPNEIRQLTWSMFDRESWTMRLDPRVAKIGKGRTLALEGPLREIIERRLKARRLDCALVFHRTSKGRPAQPILDFMKQWKAALKAGNLPAGLLPYDLRRSALRNMVRGGTDFTVAMKISGHRTRSTFDRYNIVDETDIREAMRKTALYVGQLPTERNVLAMAANGEYAQNAHNSRAAAANVVEPVEAGGGSGWESNLSQPISADKPVGPQEPPDRENPDS